jgi:hypothetical protein
MKGGRPISWSHIRTLLEVDKEAKRRELLNLTVAKSLTSQDLAEEVKKQLESQPGQPESKPDNRGRPLRVAKDLDELIRQQEKPAADFLQRSENTWQGEHSLERQFLELTPKEHTPERAEALRRLVEVLRRLAEEARKRYREAEQVYQRMLKFAAEERARRKAAEGGPGEDTSPDGDEGAGTRSDEPPSSGTRALVGSA